MGKAKNINGGQVSSLFRGRGQRTAAATNAVAPRTPSVVPKDSSGAERRVRPDGMEMWFLDGKIHRDDGPAVVFADGTQKWYQHGNQHRDGAPAVIFPDGGEEWYQQHQLHRDGGPAVIETNGQREWYQRGESHREDGPAVIIPGDSQRWAKNGLMHREDGPAYIGDDGRQEWWIEGREYTEMEFCRMTGMLTAHQQFQQDYRPTRAESLDELLLRRRHSSE